MVYYALHGLYGKIINKDFGLSDREDDPAYYYAIPYMGLNIPFYGINSGSVGFLMNNFHIENFFTNIQQAKSTNLYPLKMRAINTKGQEFQALALNEIGRAHV